MSSMGSLRDKNESTHKYINPHEANKDYIKPQPFKDEMCVT